jgi:hypothetical protein
MIAYYDYSAGGLGYARCRDEHCASTIDSRLIDAAGLDDAGQYTAIVRGRDGFALIFYHDATLGDLKVAHCNDAACSAPALHVVDGDGAGQSIVGLFTAAAMPSDGRAVVSYYDATNRDLKVAKCQDAGCSRAHSHRVSGGDGDAGEWTSIGLRPGNELPVISYVQRETGNKTRLMLAFCGNAACFDEQLAR